MAQFSSSRRPPRARPVGQRLCSTIFARSQIAATAPPPYAGLIADEEGALYGTTGNGGINFGTVFKLTPPANGQTTWTETVLYRFCSQPSCSDGGLPLAGLIFDKEGVLYGTTFGGGSSGLVGGTVFKMTP